jgi:quinol monooxygenase YgiN
LRDAWRSGRDYVRCCHPIKEVSMPTTEKLIFTVMWEARDGEADAAADIIARFAPEARKEPGLELLMVNQSTTNPAQFLFYEVFKNAAAFEAHQQTPHFKTLILEDALPRLSKRERVQYAAL